MIDYARNIPSRELILVAPAANLVVSSELHPALVDLLIQSAAEIHGGGGISEEPDAFPTARLSYSAICRSGSLLWWTG